MARGGGGVNTDRGGIILGAVGARQGDRQGQGIRCRRLDNSAQSFNEGHTMVRDDAR